MRKLEILDFSWQNPIDDFIRPLKKFIESPFFQSRQDNDEITAMDFAEFIIADPDFFAKNSPFRKFAKMEDAHGPFWGEFMTAEVRLILRGYDINVIKQLSKYPFVNFSELLTKLTTPFALRAHTKQLSSLTSAWELLLLTGKPEAIDAAIKDHQLTDKTRSETKLDPLEVAILGRSAEQLNALIDKIPGLLPLHTRPQTAMHLAAATCQTAMVASLLKRDVPVDLLNEKGFTPLFSLYDEVYGFLKGDQLKNAEEIAICLLKHGANLNQKFPKQTSYLRLAIRKPDIATTLVRYGIDTNADKLEHISYAMLLHSYESLKVFLDYGMQCSEQELQDAKIELHTNYNFIEHKVSLQFRKENSDAYYWYCLGVVRNNIDDFKRAAKLGLQDANLRIVNLMLKSPTVSETDQVTIDQLLRDSLQKLPDVITDKEYHRINLLVQIAEQLKNLNLLADTKLKCDEMISKHFNKDFLLSGREVEKSLDVEPQVQAPQDKPEQVVAEKSEEPKTEKPQEPKTQKPEEPKENPEKIEPPKAVLTTSSATLFTEKPKEPQPNPQPPKTVSNWRVWRWLGY